MPKDWAKGLRKETDARVARAAEGHRGLRYVRRSAVDRRRGPGSRLEALSWTPELAYAVGLAATDGCLINTGRHVAFVSNDLDQMEAFLTSVGRNPSASGLRKTGNTYRVQFGDVELYRWLEAAGLTQRKSLTLGRIDVPERIFLDLVRGLLDGDGSVAHYVHRPVARNYPGYLYRRLTVRFHSASPEHLRWLQQKLGEVLSIKGAVVQQSKNRAHNMFALQYGKYASISLLTKLYEDPASPRLARKWLIWQDFKAQPVTTRPYRRTKTS
ncbi:MAG TPA: hypothetical protein VNO21_17085 [Polyangiaceae bacterium]|nr:hypothetical protein [Polyangiaceae bacterium]